MSDVSTKSDVPAGEAKRSTPSKSFLKQHSLLIGGIIVATSLFFFFVSPFTPFMAGLLPAGAVDDGSTDRFALFLNVLSAVLVVVLSTAIIYLYWMNAQSEEYV